MQLHPGRAWCVPVRVAAARFVCLPRLRRPARRLSHRARAADQIAVPDVFDDTTFAMLVRGATSGTSPVTVQVVLRSVTAKRARATPVYDHDVHTAERTTSWLRAVSNTTKRRFKGACQRFSSEFTSKIQSATACLKILDSWRPI